MTDVEIVIGLCKLQATGDWGAVHARCYVTGAWLAQWRFDLICAALLKLAGPELKQQLQTRRIARGTETETDAARLLAALRGQV